MWAIDNQTPYAAERTFVRDRNGAEVWLVAVRATYDLFPDGTLELSKEQVPVVQAPLYHGKPGQSSLRYDSDLPRTKIGTDILINASAHVPSNQEDATELQVGFQIASLKKSLRVRGEQVWEKSLGCLFPSPIRPFRSLAVRYEFACGCQPEEVEDKSLFAHAKRNPVGSGLMCKEGEKLARISNWNESSERPDLSRPVPGLGPIAGHWSPRRELAGTYDAKWQREMRPLLPVDFQDAFFQAAPADQIYDGFLRGGETVSLNNLSASGPMHFQLPRHAFGFRTSVGGSMQHHRADLHTLVIEPDEQRLTMVWQTALPCHHTLYTLKRTVLFEKSRLQGSEVAA